MCVLITVGVSGLHGDVTAPFRAFGFTTQPAVNPTSAAMPKNAIRIDVTAGGCSCALYQGDTPDPADAESERLRIVRKYARKGWSQAKIDRALGSRDHSSQQDRQGPKDLSENHAEQFAAAIESLSKLGARLTLLAHSFKGSFAEPFEISGATELPLDHYLKGHHYFPEDMLVTLVP